MSICGIKTNNLRSQNKHSNVKSSDSTWRHLDVCRGGEFPKSWRERFDEGMHKVCLCSILVDGVLLQATFFLPHKLSVYSEKICFAFWREEMGKSESQSTASPKDTMWVSS